MKLKNVIQEVPKIFQGKMKATNFFQSTISRGVLPQERDSRLATWPGSHFDERQCDILQAETSFRAFRNAMRHGCMIGCAHILCYRTHHASMHEPLPPPHLPWLTTLHIVIVYENVEEQPADGSSTGKLLKREPCSQPWWPSNDLNDVSFPTAVTWRAIRVSKWSRYDGKCIN